MQGDSRGEAPTGGSGLHRQEELAWLEPIDEDALAVLPTQSRSEPLQQQRSCNGSDRSSGSEADMDEEMLTWTPRLRGRSFSESFVMSTVIEKKHLRPLGVSAVCFVTYFNVSGGLFGSEEIISSMGPLPGLVGLVFFTFLFSLPMVFVTAELSSAFPDNGGYSIWVAEAFGSFAGFQEAYCSWLSGVVDTAIYPILAYDTAIQIIRGDWSKPIDDDSGDWNKYCNVSAARNSSSNNHLAEFVALETLTDSVGGDIDAHISSWIESYIAKFCLMLIFTLPNLMGSNFVGRSMMALAAFVLLPFLFQCLYIIFTKDMHFGALLQIREHASADHWVQLISVLYWNMSGFDSASTCAGEVRRPGKTYPRALSYTLALVFLTYFIPLSVFTTVANPDWHCWDEGWFSVIGQKEVGWLLALWIVIASFAGNAGMYSAEIFEDSWQLCGMARAGLMPEIFGTRYKDDGPPYVAIGFALLVVAALIALDFNAIVAVTNMFSCLTAMLEILAFLRLRQVEPELRRPFKVPIENLWLLSLMMIIPLSLGCLVLLTSLYSWISIYINASALLIGIMLYFYMRYHGKIQYFYEISEEEFSTPLTSRQ